MKIDSVITMEVKTREEELEDLLKAGGELSEAVCRAIIKIRNETEPTLEVKWWEELDNAISKYMQYTIEYDRLKKEQLKCLDLIPLDKLISRLKTDLKLSKNYADKFGEPN